MSAEEITFEAQDTDAPVMAEVHAAYDRAWKIHSEAVHANMDGGTLRAYNEALAVFMAANEVYKAAVKENRRLIRIYNARMKP